MRWDRGACVEQLHMIVLLVPGTYAEVSCEDAKRSLIIEIDNNYKVMKRKIHFVPSCFFALVIDAEAQ